MCGRFAIGETDGPGWRDWLMVDPEIDWPPADWPRARWNVAPTDPVGVARWGLVPHWWRKPLSEFRMATFNARAEEAAGKPAFRDCWASRRCLIPAIGYYEWTGPKGAKTPWFVTMRRNSPGLLFAGLWSEANLDGQRLLTCTILTTEAGAATRHLHPRSPVVLSGEAAEAWLGCEADPAPLLRPIPDDRVQLWPVDRGVGQVRNDGPRLIEPVGLAI